MVKGLPSQYAFYLKCCLDEKCFHPLASGSAESTSSWFPGGPSVTYFPFPVPDTSQPWGNPHCSKCEGQCWGHFLDPKTAITSTLPPMKKPPSQLLKEAFNKLKDDSDKYIPQVARECLLSPAEVEMWFDHLRQIQKNRKRGAAKAAETRRQKRIQANMADLKCRNHNFKFNTSSEAEGGKYCRH